MNTDTIGDLIIAVKTILPNAEVFYAGDRVLIETYQHIQYLGEITTA